MANTFNHNGKVVITDGGNVGVGTDSPVSHSPSRRTLVVSDAVNGANVEIWGDSSGKSVLQSVGGNTYVGNLASGGGAGVTYITSGNGSTYTTFLANGNVGIGTTSPGFRLHIKSSGLGSYPLVVQRAANNNNIFYIYEDGSGNGTLTIENSGGGAAVSLNSNGVSYLNGGNVGIGATSPMYKLVVQSGTGINSEFRDDAGNALAIRTLSGRIDFLSTYEVSAANMDISFTPTTSGGVQTEAMRIQASTGNVGIGTTSPSEKLHVAGAIYSASLVYGESYLAFTEFRVRNNENYRLGTNGTDFRLNSVNDITFSTTTSYTERMRITAAGNVGIGTTSPDAKLVVVGSGTGVAKIGDAGFGSGNYTGISLNGTLSTANYNILSSPTDSTLYINRPTGATIQFRENNTTQVIIAAAGNVGIGTTSPARKLDIVSSSAQIRISDGTPNTYWDIASLFFQSNQDFIIQNQNNVGILINSSGNVGLGTATPETKIDVRGSARFGATSVSNGDVDLWSSSNGIHNGSSITWRMNTGGGNPNSAISRIQPDVYNPSRSYINALDFYVGDWNNNNNVGPALMSIMTTGNVGIGTTSPSVKLDIETASGWAGLDLNGASGGEIRLQKSGTTYGQIYASDSTALVINGASEDIFQVAGSEKMRITSAGNVGIGTTSPNSKLVVRRDVTDNDLSQFGRVQLELAGSTDSNKQLLVGFETENNYGFIQTLAFGTSWSTYNLVLQWKGGNVGIGTTSPGYKLQVEGNISIGSDSTGLSNPKLVLNTTSYRWFTQGVSGSYRISQDGGGDFLTVLPSSGNVGIGTTSPGTKLHVYETTAGVGGVLVGNASNSTSAYSAVRLQSDYPHSYYPGLFLNSSTNTAYAGADQLMLYQFHSKPIALVTDNIVRLTVTGSGNVGIGTTSPSEKLHVDGNVIVTYNNSFQGINSIGNKAILARVSPTTGIINYAEYATATNLNGFVLGSDDARVKGDIATDSLDFITNTSSRMFINSSGNVGIATTSPGAKLDVSGNIRTSTYYNFNGNPSNPGDSIASLYDQAGVGPTLSGLNVAFRAGSTPAEAMRITSAGNVGIATASPSYKLDVVGDSRITSGSLGVGVAPNATDGRIDASNDIVAYSTSDQRLKENVTPIENALDKVKTLTGVEFDWKEETAHVHGYHGHDVGIIAQDVQAVLPEAVRTNESGYLSVRYEKMIALLIEANKELAARVELLEQKLKQ